jgi:cell division protein FtsQ
MDPRFADRREEVQRENRRRLALRLGGILGVLVLVGGLIALARSPLFDVDTVEISGADGAGRDAVLQATADLIGTPLIDVDLGDVADDVRSVPWVASVHVERDWPSGIVIEVTERSAVARVAVGERWQVIDADGRVLAEVEHPDDELLELVGVQPAASPGDRLESADELLEVAGALTPAVQSRVTGVRVGDTGELELLLDPHGVIRFGDTTQLDDKMLALATLLTRVDDRCIQRIDVRVPAAPTIVRGDRCAGPATTTTTVWTPPVTDTTATTGLATATTAPVTTVAATATTPTSTVATTVVTPSVPATAVQ